MTIVSTYVQYIIHHLRAKQIQCFSTGQLQDHFRTINNLSAFNAKSIATYYSTLHNIDDWIHYHTLVLEPKI